VSRPGQIDLAKVGHRDGAIAKFAFIELHNSLDKSQLRRTGLFRPICVPQLKGESLPADLL
jgi:hypothetical protein